MSFIFITLQITITILVIVTIIFQKLDSDNLISTSFTRKIFLNTQKFMTRVSVALIIALFVNSLILAKQTITFNKADDKVYKKYQELKGVEKINIEK